MLLPVSSRKVGSLFIGDDDGGGTGLEKEPGEGGRRAKAFSHSSHSFPCSSFRGRKVA